MKTLVTLGEVIMIKGVKENNFWGMPMVLIVKISDYPI